MIDFHFVNTKKIALEKSKKWLKKVVKSENKKLQNLVFIFCDDNYLLKKNIKFLKHKTLTDVITFDYCNGNQINGDVFISVERVKENCQKFNTTFLNELDRVMVHGLLHLLGYKDQTKSEAKIMRQKEDFYLDNK